MRDAGLFKIAPLVADIGTYHSSRPVMTYSPTSKKSPSQQARQALVSWPRFAEQQHTSDRHLGRFRDPAGHLNDPIEGPASLKGQVPSYR